MLTPVSTFSLPGSISLIALPSHPSEPIWTGSQVCHTSIARKCDLLAPMWPTPCTTATSPWSYISFSGAALGWNPRPPSMGSASSSGTVIFCRAS